jgi:hypothetical protein
MGKETIIDTVTGHCTTCKPRVSFNKLDITSGWVFQQFHLVMKYNKRNTNKLVYILSRPPTFNITTLGTHMHLEPFTHDAYKEAYTKYEDFKEVFQQL